MLESVYKKKRILAVCGTRPDAIKLCPVVAELSRRAVFDCQLCLTGQHAHTVRSTTELFGLSPCEDLGVMRLEQTLHGLTALILEGMRDVLERHHPDLVLVHGDTATAFAASLAAFYSGIKVAHVEAGLRTYDLSEPFPEEWNRRSISLIAKHHFAPTERARQNLLREGIDPSAITVTGNTAIDALRTTVRLDYHHSLLRFAEGGRLLILTCHRRESVGEPMRQILRGVRRALCEFEDLRLVCPLHPNPAVRALVKEELADLRQVCLVDSLDVLTFHNLLARSYLVLTDSGGIQEEAPALNKPVLVLRNCTERPEGLEAGVARLAGTTEGSVYRGICELIENDALYYVMAHAKSPYGDGNASVRIADALEKDISII